jgi:hypothetical protein
MAPDSRSTDAGDSRGDDHDDARARYERTKRDFEDMSLEQQASFLVEAGASALARGLEQAGRSLADEIDRIFRKTRPGRHGDTGSGPGPAEPETSQRSAPR